MEVSRAIEHCQSQMINTEENQMKTRSSCINRCPARQKLLPALYLYLWPSGVSRNLNRPNYQTPHNWLTDRTARISN